MGGSSGADHEEVSLINICDVHLIAETAGADVACDDVTELNQPAIDS
jgi:hypothetical protein